MRHISLRGTAVFILLLAHMAAAGTPNRVTILYDSFGKSPTLTMDWGFAALVDYGGKRILFDTGNNAQIFEHNVKAAGVDLQKLDFVVMSHRHGDHMGGLAYLLKVNPTVKIYAPKERSGVYGDDQSSSTWYRKDPSLPTEQRYYRGAPPEIIHMGEAWPNANFQLIDKNIEIVPGMYLIALVSDTPGTLEVHELSLAIRTPDGLVLVVGSRILGWSTSCGRPVRLILTSISCWADCIRSRHRMLRLSVSPGCCMTNTSWIA